MNEWALITGASAGIGRELAKVFAANGFNLLLVARNEARLKQLADELEAAHRIGTKVVAQDLARPEAARRIYEAAEGKLVTVLVNNAGFGSHGPFVETRLELETNMIEVNVTALVQLTHLFVQPMLARRAGRILNVASTGAFQPGPLIAVYFASKAFVFSFSYALAEELAGSGVTVSTLCPGLTRTEFQERAKIRPGGFWAMDPRTVAEIGFRGLMRRQRVVIPGVLNRIGVFWARRLPHRLTSAVVKRLH